MVCAGRIYDYDDVCSIEGDVSGARVLHFTVTYVVYGCQVLVRCHMIYYNYITICMYLHPHSCSFFRSHRVFQSFFVPTKKSRSQEFGTRFQARLL